MSKPIIKKADFEKRVLELYRKGLQSVIIAERLGHRSVVDAIISKAKAAKKPEAAE